LDSREWYLPLPHSTKALCLRANVPFSRPENLNHDTIIVSLHQCVLSDSLPEEGMESAGKETSPLAAQLLPPATPMQCHALNAGRLRATGALIASVSPAVPASAAGARDAAPKERRLGRRKARREANGAFNAHSCKYWGGCSMFGGSWRCLLENREEALTLPVSPIPPPSIHLFQTGWRGLGTLDSQVRVYQMTCWIL
jgi:hypothetical protein